MATARTHYPLDIPESRWPSRAHERGEVFPRLLEPTGPASSTAPGQPLGLLAGPTLRFMDWVGNARHGLTPAIWLNKLGLYAAPATWFFDRSLHFIARLDKV